MIISSKTKFIFTLFLVFYIFGIFHPAGGHPKGDSFLSVSVAFAVDNGQDQPQTNRSVQDIIGRGYEDISEQIYGEGKEPDVSVTAPAALAGKIISYFFMAAALIFLVLVAVSGFEWMAAAGNEEQIKKAQNLLMRAIVGFIISFLGFVAVRTFGPAIFEAIGL